MSTQPYEIIAGPADVWVSPVGTPMPAVDAAESAFDGAWVAMGKTEGGIQVTHDQDIELLYADQRTGPLKAIRTREGLMVEFELAEITLERYAKLLNDATVTTSGSPNRKEMKPYQGLDVAQFAVLVRGPSPYTDGFLQYQVPVAVQVEAPEVTFVKDDKSTLSCQWAALEDPDASTAADRFGKLVAANA
jgi:hypothetical protein